jgi:hypothetical protein
MVAAILAVVSGERRRNRITLALWHLAGLLLGAVALAVAVSLLAAILPLPHTVLGVAVAAAALVWGGAALLGRPLPLASSSAQVPRWWQYTLTPRQFAFSYGVGLGIGFLTRILTISFYVLVALFLLAGNPIAAITAAGAYGFARGLPVLLAAADGSSAEEIGEKTEHLRAIALKVDSLALVTIGIGVLFTTV